VQDTLDEINSAPAHPRTLSGEEVELFTEADTKIRPRTATLIATSATSKPQGAKQASSKLTKAMMASKAEQYGGEHILNGADLAAEAQRAKHAMRQEQTATAAVKTLQHKVNRYPDIIQNAANQAAKKATTSTLAVAKVMAEKAIAKEAALTQTAEKAAEVSEAQVDVFVKKLAKVKKVAQNALKVTSLMVPTSTESNDDATVKNESEEDASADGPDLNEPSPTAAEDEQRDENRMTDLRDKVSSLQDRLNTLKASSADTKTIGDVEALLSTASRVLSRKEEDEYDHIVHGHATEALRGNDGVRTGHVVPAPVAAKVSKSPAQEHKEATGTPTAGDLTGDYGAQAATHLAKAEADMAKVKAWQAKHPLEHDIKDMDKVVSETESAHKDMMLVKKHKVVKEQQEDKHPTPAASTEAAASDVDPAVWAKLPPKEKQWHKERATAHKHLVGEIEQLKAKMSALDGGKNTSTMMVTSDVVGESRNVDDMAPWESHESLHIDTNSHASKKTISTPWKKTNTVETALIAARYWRDVAAKKASAVDSEKKVASTKSEEDSLKAKAKQELSAREADAKQAVDDQKKLQSETDKTKAILDQANAARDAAKAADAAKAVAAQSFAAATAAAKSAADKKTLADNAATAAHKKADELSDEAKAAKATTATDQRKIQTDIAKTNEVSKEGKTILKAVPQVEKKLKNEKEAAVLKKVVATKAAIDEKNDKDDDKHSDTYVTVPTEVFIAESMNGTSVETYEQEEKAISDKEKELTALKAKAEVDKEGIVNTTTQESTELKKALKVVRAAATKEATAEGTESSKVGDNNKTATETAEVDPILKSILHAQEASEGQKVRANKDVKPVKPSSAEASLSLKKQEAEETDSTPTNTNSAKWDVIQEAVESAKALIPEEHADAVKEYAAKQGSTAHFNAVAKLKAEIDYTRHREIAQKADNTVANGPVDAASSAHSMAPLDAVIESAKAAAKLKKELVDKQVAADESLEKANGLIKSALKDNYSEEKKVVDGEAKTEAASVKESALKASKEYTKKAASLKKTMASEVLDKTEAEKKKTKKSTKSGPVPVASNTEVIQMLGMLAAPHRQDVEVPERTETEEASDKISAGEETLLDNQILVEEMNPADEFIRTTMSHSAKANRKNPESKDPLGRLDFDSQSLVESLF